MRESVAVARALRTGLRLLAVVGALHVCRGAALAACVCVGDCNGDGQVAVNELVTGVNIALGRRIETCRAFDADESGQVTIDELTSAVSNAIDGCPTVCITGSCARPGRGPRGLVPCDTGTLVRAYRCDDRATCLSALSPALASTAVQAQGEWGMLVQAADASDLIYRASIDGATLFRALGFGPIGGRGSLVAGGTRDVRISPISEAAVRLLDLNGLERFSEAGIAALLEAVDAATSTLDFSVLEASGYSPADAADLATLTAVSDPAVTDALEDGTIPGVLPTRTPTPTVSHTATPSSTATPTDTPFPVGERVAGRAAIIAAGLSGIQSVVAAVMMALTNGGPAEQRTFGGLAVDAPASPLGQVVCPPCPPQPPGTDCDCCPSSGFTTRACNRLGLEGINVALGASSCVTNGPSGGSESFDGAIFLSAALGRCPFTFTIGTYTVHNLTIVLRDDTLTETLNVTADLNGTIAPTASGTACLVSALDLTLNGTLTSALPDGLGVQVDFTATSATIDRIDFGPECVPFSYRLTVSGPTTFSPLPDGAAFSVLFSNLALEQEATSNPVMVEMRGTMSSGCFGGAIGLQTVSPIAVVAGELCPSAGLLDVSSAGAMAAVTYQNGQVTVDQGGTQHVFPTCLAAELLACP